MGTSPLLATNSSRNSSREPDFSPLHTEKPSGAGLSLWEEEPGELQFMRQQNQDPDGLRFPDQLNVENAPEKRSSFTEVEEEEIELESIDDHDDADIVNHNEKKVTSAMVDRKKEHRKREASKGKPQPRVGKKQTTLHLSVISIDSSPVHFHAPFFFTFLSISKNAR